MSPRPVALLEAPAAAAGTVGERAAVVVYGADARVRAVLRAALGGDASLDVTASTGEWRVLLEAVAGGRADRPVTVFAHGSSGWPSHHDLGPTAAVVAVLPDGDGAAAAVVAAFAAEVDGVVLADTAPALLRAAARAAAAGVVPVDPRLGAPSHQWLAHGGSPVLSGRERDVLRLLGEGLLNKQIARRLGITTATVKSHLTRVYERLGVPGRAAAVAWVAAHDPPSADRVRPAAPAP